jgi:hypothetical protein
MMVLLMMFSKKIRLLYVALTTTLLINQAYVLYYLNMNAFIPQGDLVVLSVSVINLIMFLYASILLWDEFKGRRIQDTAQPKAVEQQVTPQLENAQK